MNCGSCLFTNAKVVALIDDVCPECGADYTHPATEEEIAKQAANCKPVAHTAGRTINPPKATVKEVKSVEASGALTSEAPMASDNVIKYLRENGHVSEETALGAMQASKIFGKGIASSLAALGRISTAGNKRGAKYWFQPAVK
jgi:hypothetical protein